MALMLLLVGCSPDLLQKPAADEVPLLDSTQLLSRISLDLRGVRPSEEELAAVEADPAQLDADIDTFLADERFGGRVRSMFSDIYLTRQDSWPITAEDYGLTDEPGFAKAVGEEPLRVLSYVAENDLPYSEVVTGDWTMANELLAGSYPVDYPQGETGWKKVHYTDGRPAAGVLSTNGFWWHYGSTLSNSNRGRANAISKIFLCNDYLARPIEFSRDVNLLDRDAVADAVRNNPGCNACHSSLDPLAAYTWGYYYVDPFSRIDVTYYHPEREQLWQNTTDVAPGYYGEPGETMADLGWQIAGDHRFAECVSKQVQRVLLQREDILEDTEQLSADREAFVQNGLTLRPLFKEVLKDEAYRANSDASPRYVPRKMMGPDLLASQIEGITGFRFTYDGYDMMSTDSYGLRILAGGVDGVYAIIPATDPTTTMLLVQERLAQGAAAYAVAQDAQNTENPRIFTEVDFSETPDNGKAQMVKQIQKLHRMLLGHTVDEESQEVADNLELWQQLYAVDGDAKAAWSGLLSVLMRDPDFILY